MKYFVSYTTRDKEVTKDLLVNFSKELKKLGSVFVDILNNDSVDKQARVISELDSSDVLILIESKSIYKSDWVTAELQRAQEKNIPIKIILLSDIQNLSEERIISRFHILESIMV